MSEAPEGALPSLLAHGFVMRLILVGPPGTGKGTQAKLLSERQGLTHIGTGDILREAIRLGTPLGKRARPYVDSGQLVPDDLVNDLIAERFQRADRPHRFVMDGYPRTRSQADIFDRVLEQQGITLCAVVLLATPDEEIIRRLTGRWSCPKCKATYHLLSKPPKNDKLCDTCQSELFQRVDDQEATVRERMRLYHATTGGMVEHYRQKGLLQEAPGQGDIETIFARIVEILKQADSSC